MVVQCDVDVRLLNLSQVEILKTMGVGASTPDSLTQSLIEELTEMLYSVAKPKYCYTIVLSTDFTCGKIIADALKDGERFAIVVSTAGQEVDNLLHELRDSDFVKAFVADTVASEIVEATSREAIKELESILADGEKISNPYSPGYCGWALREQTKLFSRFETQPCGVTLNDSCLMLPVKSVSAVLAIGRNVVKAPYGCAICTKTDCYKKKNNL